MTSETKIGLVVGLGFIVTFAVILSKKAAVSPYALLEEDITLGEEGLVSVVKSDKGVVRPQDQPGSAVAIGDLPNRKDQSGSDDPTRNLHLRAPQEKHETVAVHPKSGRGASSQEAIVQRSAEEGAGMGEIPLPSMGGEAMVSKKRPAAGSGLVTIEMVIPPQEAAPVGKAGTGSPEATPAGNPAPEDREADIPKTDERPRKPTSPPEIRPSFKEYITKAGDSLMKIARQSYGVDTPEAIDRIYEANQKTLKDRHTLKVGQKLVIPSWVPPGQAELAQDFPGAGIHSGLRKVEEFPTAAKAEPAEEEEKAVAEKPMEKRSPPKEYRMYTVKEHDSFSTIAQSEMGTSKLWKELYDLNRDKFPRPESLRVGALIRVPANVLASNSSDSDRAGEE